jgi:hypothetical protein
MSIYKSKPKIIEAVEFNPDDLTNLRGVDLNEIKSVSPPTTEYQIYNRLHSSWIGIKPGDMVRIDQPNDHYPIDKAYFEENYLPMEC